jgi:hypothetical protein
VVPEILFIFFFYEMSGFIYHHLSVSLYVLAILVVIVKNDLESKRNLCSGAAIFIF